MHPHCCIQLSSEFGTAAAAADLRAPVPEHVLWNLPPLMCPSFVIDAVPPALDRVTEPEFDRFAGEAPVGPAGNNGEPWRVVGVGASLVPVLTPQSAQTDPYQSLAPTVDCV